MKKNINGKVVEMQDEWKDLLWRDKNSQRNSFYVGISYLRCGTMIIARLSREHTQNILEDVLFGGSLRLPVLADFVTENAAVIIG